MSMIPVASFLAGALLSTLLPIALLIFLAVWHMRSIRHIPGGDAATARRATTAEHAAPAAGTPGATQVPPAEPPVGAP